MLSSVGDRMDCERKEEQMSMRSFALIGVVLCGCTWVGCGSDAGREDPDSGTLSDARCIELCAIEDAGPERMMDTCSAASARRCLERCEARIAGADTACANCLLEGATFAPGVLIPHVECVPSSECESESECTAIGAVTCSYCDLDIPMLERCLRDAFPPSEVECTPTFEPTASCVEVCDPRDPTSPESH